ncbi:hypothetical protein A1O3_03225 [Capronia epimyces CBS 606.96]|uniref:Zn(2)-C6 fungal-type domain-containing protein n=1 Tax=Capronia epimyces CBS 606.96 TaxID=1182542 RepID=W9YLN3_9EURO|nr:uncharacterized protein A1O3_03225 [Capronia epimyces CBS 606.96]EXJ90156.1 hypothetical protein A1O3_03225 [Capronia epimyces CBS 606.96]
MSPVTQGPPSVQCYEDSAVGDLIEVSALENLPLHPPPTAPVSTQRKTAQRRGRNGSHACIECQARKVRCSEEPQCSHCQALNLVCEYKPPRKKRATNVARKASLDLGDTDGISRDDTPQRGILMQMMERIAELERNYASLLMDVKAESDQASPYSRSGSHPGPQSECAMANIPEKELFRGRTSLIEQFGVLDRSIASETANQPDSGLDLEGQGANTAPVTWSELPRSSEKDVETLEEETRHFDLASLRKTVDTFFAHLNPHYPCISENAFRPLFEKFLNNEELQELGYADRQQFVALVNLIQAEIRILSDEWPTSTRAPAWEEFCRAESILSRLAWLGNGNIMTIQCLLVKARYLLYAEKPSGAYDTMGRAVRLSWQLGLHDQQSWSGLSPFEVVMRQRIFWTVFYLERNIALHAGAPYLIRQSDFKVDLPPNLDDRLLFPDRPLPTPEGCPTDSYLAAASRWGYLTAEIWDTIYAVNAQRPTSAEFIATMDARIQFTGSRIPPKLQWARNLDHLDGNAPVPRYVLRQAAILYQRMNQLRLLLRQERMLSLGFDDEMAKDCTTISGALINAIHASHYSPTHTLTDRYSACLYLSSALLPLVCIIVKSECDPAIREDAIQAYNKGLSTLQALVPSFSAARHTLQRLLRITQTTERAIQRFRRAEQFLLDPSEFETETLMLQMNDFLGHDHQGNWEMDFFNDDQAGPYSLGAMDGMHADLLG